MTHLGKNAFALLLRFHEIILHIAGIFRDSPCPTFYAFHAESLSALENIKLKNRTGSSLKAVIERESFPLLSHRMFVQFRVKVTEVIPNKENRVVESVSQNLIAFDLFPLMSEDDLSEAQI
ncbi:MAG: hypothetical protein DMG71_01335 [Acidobacteria bacterium]|nr:MAG: hypothetical protein DMG71_01335 [Acidobacteriota bacterium]